LAVNRAAAPSETAPAPEPEERDGRRLRSQDSRARIVQAMLSLIQAGDVSPSAEQVADKAGVGLRTVFRHFKDMESLFREMSDVIAGEVSAIKDQPFRAPDWRGRIIELIDRRCTIFERIAPLKRASDIQRHRSPTIRRDSRGLVSTLREILERVAPPDEVDDPLLFEALDLLLSFESWSRLRLEQGLGEVEARRVLEAAARRLIGAAPA
jgi:AcrR family transcriptional regulator